MKKGITFNLLIDCILIRKGVIHHIFSRGLAGENLTTGRGFSWL